MVNSFFLVHVNEEDYTRIFSMQKGGNMREMFTRFCKDLKLFEDAMKEKGGVVCVPRTRPMGSLHELSSHRQLVHVELASGIHSHLPFKPGHWLALWGLHQVSKAVSGCQVPANAEEAPSRQEGHW